MQGSNNVEPTKRGHGSARDGGFATTFFDIGIGIICFGTIGVSRRLSLGASEGGYN